MTLKLRAVTVLLVLMLCATGVVAHAAPALKDSLDTAMESAKEKRRLVLLVFSESDNPESDKFQNETLKDPTLAAWIEKNAVLCVLARDATARIAEFFVVEYPTSVFLSAKGEILGRLDGRWSAGMTLEDAKGIKGETSRLAVARKAYEAHSENVEKRYDYARELADVGDFRKALEHYLWLFDNVLKYRKSFYGVRLSFMLSAIAEIGKRYPVAHDELRKRRDAAREKLRAKEGGHDQVADFTSINDYLDEKDETLALYDELKKAPGIVARIVKALGRECVDILVERKRYEEAAEALGDLNAACRERLSRYDMDRGFQERRAKEREEGEPDFVELDKEFFRKDIGELVEIACGSGQVDTAEKIAAKLFEKLKDGKSYAAVINGAVRAGSVDFAAKMKDEGLKVFDKAADLDPIREAAKTIPQPDAPKDKTD
jgi:hypothetical protein